MASILVVCTGNVCRSPIAEAALRAVLQTRFGDAAPSVSSVGTMAWVGEGAVPQAVDAAAERGLDLGPHIATYLSPELIGNADLIVCIATEHREAIRAARPSVAADRANDGFA